jgi:pilus assembly protein CpaF
MSIRERLQHNAGAATPTAEPRTPRRDMTSVTDLLKAELLDRLDFVRAGALTDDELRGQIRHILQAIIEERELTLGNEVIARLIGQVEDETLGLGPLEELLQDPNVTDILVNGHCHVYVERFGKMELTDVRFRSEADLLQVIDRIVSRVGRRIDEASPMVDARLADGSRVNAIVPPLALDGPALSIRRFGARAIHMQDLVGWRALTPEMGELLRAAVRARLNIVISGGTGSGKTTLLNALSCYSRTSSGSRPARRIWKGRER